MKNKLKKLMKFIPATIILCVLITAWIVFNVPKNADSQYVCHVNPFAVSLQVDVKNTNGDSVYNIDGEFFSTFEDHLLMSDKNENVVREMDDEYNFISQNDHTILDGNGFLYHMVGESSLGPNEYTLYNNHKESVGTIEFNLMETSGIMRDVDGNIIARYNSNLFNSKYVVSIFRGCEVDDESVLMMFASFVSDMRADD